MKFASGVVSFAVLAILSSGQAAAEYQGPKVQFKLAHPAPPGSHITAAYKKFADLVKEKSDGRIQVKLFPGSILGSDRVMIEGAQRGTLEVGVSSTPNLASFTPVFQVFDLPYITSPDKQEQLYLALDKGQPLHVFLEQAANDIGLQPLMYAEYGYRNFVSKSRPLTGPDSLAGLKMRTTDSPVDVAVAKALGANPSPIAWGEVYTALQQGTIDAQGNTFDLMVGAKHHENLKYAITSAHNYGMQVAMANKKWWDSLPDETKAILEEASAEALEYQRTVAYPADQQKARESMVAAGVTIHETTAEDMARFRELTRPVFEEFAERLPAELVKLVQDTQS
ncbi:TRAP transporter substrate-binding protein [Zobellella iuensis]|jgi:tripartite ATP-independent transporter DctP family solute receptor|uniref:TRAP transporter substrate-binding protein n=1 Tax=Zobellella iuensis TaxID=2803811 RepID=A0ABS1QNQ9_9GAMM|nr:TRAP transporter substrate-binding protein [Zobellella iuensis]MBL1376494.1 TRAP transporter substrate-binding protein [Zobellella iuensis]